MNLYVFSIRRIKVLAIFLILILLTSVFACYMILNDRHDLSVSSAIKDIPIYSVESDKMKLSITFDCAWGADDIPLILKTLKQYGATATFFMVGEWAKKHQDAVRQIASSGHDIANHSYSHARMGIINKDKIKSEIAKCNDVLKEITLKDVELFRAPYGEYNDTVIRTAKELGCYTIQWDVDSLDWKPLISKEEIIDRISKKAKSGSIILFHNDTPFTAKVLPTILDMLKSRNFSFVPVSQLILRENYQIDYSGRQRPSRKTPMSY